MDLFTMNVCNSLNSVNRRTIDDWRENVYSTVAEAEYDRIRSWNARHLGKSVIDEVRINNHRVQIENNVLLGARIENLSQWKHGLELTLRDVKREKSMLATMKNECEEALRGKITCEKINKHCFLIRDRRRNVELVKDAVENQLFKEEKLIENSKKRLNDQCREIFDQLLLLTEVQQSMEKDLSDNIHALAVDERSENPMSLNPNPNPNRSMNVDDRWLEESKGNLLRAEEEIEKSRRLLEASRLLVTLTDSDVLVQKELVDFEFRKRIHEEQQALAMLKWQKETLEEEIGCMRVSIRDLEMSYQSTDPSLKLVDTLLENRYRPKGLCQDEVKNGLITEMNCIIDSQGVLRETIASARVQLNRSEGTLSVVNFNMCDKMSAIEVEEECQCERKKFPVTLSKNYEVPSMSPNEQHLTHASGWDVPLTGGSGDWQVASQRIKELVL